MICPQCGRDNPDTAKYCDQCGTPLLHETHEPVSISKEQPENTKIEHDDESLISLAEGYTANLAAAKEIVRQAKAKDNPLKAIREFSLSYVRSKEPELFSGILPPKDGKEELSHLSNQDEELRALTYEERFVVLMSDRENLTDEKIAEELGITKDDVISLKQSAFEKDYPDGKRTAQKQEPKKANVIKPVKRESAEQKPKTAKTKKPHHELPKTAIIVITSVIAVILGVWLGIHNYANGQYAQGKDALEKEDYESAVEHFSNAIHWGAGGDEAVKELSLAYAGNEDYQNAAEQMEEYINLTNDTSMNATLAEYDSKLAEASVESEDWDSAADLYAKAYELDQNEFTKIRMSACQNQGTYTDDDGSTYNANGHLTNIQVDEEDGTSYEVTLEYSDDGKLKEITAINSEKGTRMNFQKFSSDFSSIEFMVYPSSSNALCYYAHEEDGEESEYYYGTYGTYLFTLDLEKDADGQIQTVKRTNQETGEILTSEYAYEDDLLHSITTTSSLNTDAWIEEFTYDEDGRLIERTVMRNLLSAVEHETFTYDDNGNISQREIERKEVTMEESLMPYEQYSLTKYTCTGDGEIYKAEVFDANGSTVAKGYGIPNNGIVWFYSAAVESSAKDEDVTAEDQSV